MKNIVKKVLEIAAKEVGVREKGGNNYGKRVEEYQRADNLPGVGYAWCASFVAWCLKQAGDIPYCNSASCDVVLVWGRKSGLVYNTPEPGDIFLRLAKNSENDAIHTGFVKSVNGAVFDTIEGNTNIDGSSDGIGVFARQRTNSSSYRFVRWHDLIKDDTAAVPEPYTVKIGTKEIPSVMVGAACWVAVRAWGEALGFDIEWNATDQLVLFGGKEVGTQTRLHEGKAYAWIRDLARFSKLQLEVDNDSRSISVKK